MSKNKNKNIIYSFNVGLLSLLLITFLAHLALANHGANQRYQISQLLKNYKELETDYQKLSVTAAELQSPHRLIADSARLNLVKADTIHYITPKTAVVLNK